MAVTEVLHKLGSFDIKLNSTTPVDVLDSLDYFGHIAIVPGRVDITQVGDNLLDVARYVGVVRSRRRSDDGRSSKPGDDIAVGGVGMNFWLGDDDSDKGKGAIIETPLTFASETYANTIRALLPDAVTEGTLYAVAGAYNGRHAYKTPRSAVQYVNDTMGTTNTPLSFRVNGNATLDAGPESDLYVTDPQCVVVRAGAGEDMHLRALTGSTDVDQDMEDFTTRVLLLAEGEGESIVTANADIQGGLNPYKDIHGNDLKLTRIVSESDTSTENAQARAQLQLNRFTGKRNAMTLSTDDYYFSGSYAVGDYLYVYNPDAGLVDTNNEITFRGSRLNPIRLQVHELNWPITRGYSVGYRAGDGTWTDLTDYVSFEAQAAQKVVVGDFNRALSTAGSQPVGTRPDVDTSIPDAPTWVEPFFNSNDQDDLGTSRAIVLLAWDAPLNIDGSTVLDGDHYEIQFRPDTDAIYPQSWASVSSASWAALHTWEQPFTPPVASWETRYVAWGQSSYELNALATGVGYDVRIRAVDKAGNAGEYADTTFITTQDNIAPSTPAAPEVAGSRIAVMVVHELGRATGGTFNLEADLSHLEVHVDYEPNFTCSVATLRGTVTASQGMIQAEIPAVVSVPVEELSERYVRVVAVDKAGNKSLPSVAASATALLIDDAHISDLTVSKVTAGTISADFILGARIKTSDDGARVELNSDGIQAFNSGGIQTVDIDAETGDAFFAGTFSTRAEDNNAAIRITQSNETGAIRFYSGDGSTFARIYSQDQPSAGVDASVSLVSSPDGDGFYTLGSHQVTQWFAGRVEVLDDFYRPSGGGVLATNDSVSMFYTPDPAVFSTDSGVVVSDFSTDIFHKRGEAEENGFLMLDSRTAHYGSWGNYISASPTTGIWTASIATGAGSFTSMSGSFGATMASAMICQITPQATNYGTGTPTTHGLSQLDTSGFTYSWNNGQQMRLNVTCHRA
ncbi:hypothetical protein ACFUN8_18565 [Streptomyces sp. NPDC057307]|uniref:hypothetical protein n=1 Tax=Streptomyces sp. NPDC057307 TaxID=3346096 RepID=UPI003636E95C